MKKFIIIISTIGLILISTLGYIKSNIHQENEYLEDNRIETDRQDRLLQCVAKLESNNNPNIVVLDSNKQYSYGAYQFQVVTIKDWYQRKHQKISTQEAISIAKNTTSSRELARQMILNGEIWRWKLTKNKIIAGKCKTFEPDEINNYIK